MSYFVLPNATCLALKSQLNAADADEVNIKIWLEDETPHLAVRPDGVTANATLNNAHRCPGPNCPD